MLSPSALHAHCSILPCVHRSASQSRTGTRSSGRRRSRGVRVRGSCERLASFRCARACILGLTIQQELKLHAHNARKSDHLFCAPMAAKKELLPAFWAAHAVALLHPVIELVPLGIALNV